jgi:uncharacterized protein with PIN domain/DNA-directed RNA polymerase subunit RPC12/RpoP
MAISCPGCGREYDVTLFQFGRTIHCTCGQRVGLEHRVEIPVNAERPRFLADAMLGRLARWLRTLGYDTAYEDGISDDELVRRAFEEGRHILTRDRRLFDEWRVDGGLVIHAEKPLEQIAEVVVAFDLPLPTRLFTRCRVCNAVVRPVERMAVADRVPPRVWEREREFVECPGCGRVYWEGSHVRRMRSVLRVAFGGARAE